MGKYYVIPIEETPLVKIAEVRAISERGALQKFYGIFKVKGKIHKFSRMKYI